MSQAKKAFLELNYCENNPGICLHGSKCVSLTKDEGNYRCLCREGTYGKNCENSEFTTTTTTTQKTIITTTTSEMPSLGESSLENATLVPDVSSTSGNDTDTNTAENETN